MKKNFSLTAFAMSLLIIFSALTAVAQISVVPIAGDQQAQRHEGVYYALPKTFVRVDVWVDKVETFRGPYAEYASRLLGLENVPRVNSASYHLSSVSLSTYHEADPEQFYFARIPRKGTEGLRFSLSPEGIMQSARWEETVKEKKQTSPIILTRESSLRSEFVDFSVPNIIERVDTFIRRISVDTTTFEEVFFRKTFIEKTTEQKAREAANFILKLEDHRLSLITGYHEVNYSAEVMQFMNEELIQLQEEYLALFKGKTVTTTSHYSFVYVPQPGRENDPFTLFKFASNRGIVEKEYPVGEAVQINFRRASNVRNMANHQALREKGSRRGTGFFYRIPDKATVNIKMGDEVIAESQFLVNQLGVLSFLPYESVREIQFYPETGSVKYMRLR
jgi:hypothetical protein